MQIPFKASSFGCLSMQGSADLKFSTERRPELKSIWQIAENLVIMVHDVVEQDKTILSARKEKF